MRLFIAINIPKREKTRIHRAATPIRDRGYPVRWVTPELFHLTLKYLGEVGSDAVPLVEEAMEGVASATGPFQLDVGGFGAFPTIRRPQVIWVGVDPSPALRCLKQDLEWALSARGFDRETRAFHPHFTLGRSISRPGAGAFRGLDTLSSDLTYESKVMVHKVDLMRSHLSSTGPRYETLTKFSLKGPAGRKVD